jgi:DNA-3-methyladenine glycosylase
MRATLSFFNRPTLGVLEDLMGMVLIRKSKEGSFSGIIVEAEAYRGEDDPASFAFRGRTKKSARLYGLPGRAFVYVTYGIHHMLNIVTEREGFPAAVLIRAVEPREGIHLMMKRRKTDNLLNLCSGPAKLCQAFGIDLSLNGAQLYSSNSALYIVKGDPSKKRLIWKPRIGIRKGKDRLWRAYVKDSPFISYK